MTTRPVKVLIKILSGNSDHNINFNDLRNSLLYLGFSERIKGSHHIFYHEQIIEIINPDSYREQPKQNNAKPYQVRQVRQIITKYNLFKDEL